MTGKAKIVVQGRLDKQWAAHFDGMEISNYGKNTLISGAIVDEAHMHGILSKIRDLNLTLVSLNPYKTNNN